MTSESCSGWWFIAELCFIFIDFCTPAVGTSCPGDVVSVKYIISTTPLEEQRREDWHSVTWRRRRAGQEKHEPLFLTGKVCQGRWWENCGQWVGRRDKGEKRPARFWGQRMSFSLRVPLTLPMLKINTKTDRTAGVLCCLKTLGSAT